MTSSQKLVTSTSLVKATQVIFNRISLELFTPQCDHTTFNLRDLAKVIQGLLMTTPRSLKPSSNGNTLDSWELFRVFRDRMINQEDSDWVQNVQGLIETELGFSASDYLDDSGRLFFGDCDSWGWA